MSYGSILMNSIGDVAVIRLNDEKSLNAASPQMIEELRDAFDKAAVSRRAMVLTGVGRAFCSGANLGKVDFHAPNYDAGELLESHFNPLMMAIRELPIPIVTAVNGPAVGVGSTIALAGDLVLASEDAYFLQAFRRIGVVPDSGTAYLLTRSVGRARAMEMILLAEKISARQAFGWGLINRVLPPAELEAGALSMAAELAAGPTRTLAAIRKSCWNALDSNFQGQLENDRVVQRAVGTTADHREGVAAFFAKRRAVFTGT